MTQLVTDSMTGGGRAFAGLTVAATQGRGTAMDYQATNANLLAEIESISMLSGLGVTIDTDGSGMIFKVLQGVDRTAEQNTNPRAIFSAEFENVLAQEYDIDTGDSGTVAIVATDKDSIVETVGTATGRLRREIYVAASGLDKDENGNALNEAQKRALMQQQGKTALANAPISESFTAEVNPYGNLKYKTHYDLGDIITVSSKRWGVQVDARITEITEVYGADGETLELTLGYQESIKKILGRITA